MASGSGSGKSSASSVTSPAPRVKVLCSYGGRIKKHPQARKYIYHGGITKIVELERHISYHDVIPRLSNLFSLVNADGLVLKYQLPGFDMDDLLSVSNEKDLEFMMLEYVILKMPQRLRLFLEPPRPPRAESPPIPPPQHYNQQPQYNFQDLTLPAATPAPTSVIDTTPATPTPTAAQAEAAEKKDAPESS